MRLAISVLAAAALLSAPVAMAGPRNGMSGGMGGRFDTSVQPMTMGQPAMMVQPMTMAQPAAKTQPAATMPSSMSSTPAMPMQASMPQTVPAPVQGVQPMRQAPRAMPMAEPLAIMPATGRKPQ